LILLPRLDRVVSNLCTETLSPFSICAPGGIELSLLFISVD
jgi:hypothetical protein